MGLLVAFNICSDSTPVSVSTIVLPSKNVSFAVSQSDTDNWATLYAPWSRSWVVWGWSDQHWPKILDVTSLWVGLLQADHSAGKIRPQSTFRFDLIHPHYCHQGVPKLQTDSPARELPYANTVHHSSDLTQAGILYVHQNLICLLQSPRVK